MERQGNITNRTSRKRVISSLFILTVGFLFCSVIAVLIYYTYQAAAGTIDFCSLWTDIPGRLAIFATFYYAAGVCGSLPMPDSFRVRWLPRPFVLYRLETWRNFFRTLYLLFCASSCTFRGFRKDKNIRESSPLQGKRAAERFYDCSPFLEERSEPFQIDPTRTSTVGHFVRTVGASKNGGLTIADDSDELFMSFDSESGGYFPPLPKGKSSKQHYIPEISASSSSKSTKSPSQDPDSTDGCAKQFFGRSRDSPAVAKDKIEIKQLRSDTGSSCKTTDVDNTPPLSYPRCPWGLLKDSESSREASYIHKKNLLTEREEMQEYIKKKKSEREKRKQKSKTSSCGGIKSDSEWKTDSDDFNPLANRLPRIPQSRPGNSRRHSRSRTVPSGGFRRFSKCRVHIHKRAVSATTNDIQPDDATSSSAQVVAEKAKQIRKRSKSEKSCADYADLQSKAYHITRILTKFGQGLQTSAEGTVLPTPGQKNSCRS